MTLLHRVEDLPEWFRLASPRTFFSAVEVAKLFGFSSIKTDHSLPLTQLVLS